MDRLAYLARRLLLVIPTFLGITIVCFALTRFLPGGPVEMRLMSIKGMAAQGGGAGETGSSAAANDVTEEVREQLNKLYHFDRPIYEQYWDWLVVNRMGMSMPSMNIAPGKTAWELIRGRMPVSLWFGLVSFILTYLICIPLGILKALRHRQAFDAWSSFVVFIAYAVPSFALAMLLKMFLCGTVDGFWDVFPLGGFASGDLGSEASAWAVFVDHAWHMALPIACYVASSFAMLTLLMKNSLLDQISSDYVRTVIAKGGTRRRAIWAHAFRNSLIPIATGLGPMIGLLFAGSIIIEQLFDIPGMGLLSWNALIGRDYNVFMALLALTSLFQLIGNLISDVLYMLIDPRIDFTKK